MDTKYLVEHESDSFGWVSITKPLDWWPAITKLDANNSGRPLRLVEVDADGDFVRVVDGTELVDALLRV